MPAPPTFAGSSELLSRAFDFALEAHQGSGGGGTDIGHPAAVGELLAAGGFDDEVIAAALLHDVVEDTDRGLDEIEKNFGEGVRELVDVMTEDDSITDYAERKAEHRVRVLSAGPIPSAIYVADKLARARRYGASGEPVAPHRLEHYRTTLRQFAGARPELPFLDELAVALQGLEIDSG
jgi:(p)ppGpp synthase/HD superfamily hydrolase